MPPASTRTRPHYRASYYPSAELLCVASSQIVIDLLSPNPNSPSYCVITHTVSPDPAVAPRMAWSPADGDYSWPPKNHLFHKVLILTFNSF